jgi:hypothetical protein
VGPNGELVLNFDVSDFPSTEASNPRQRALIRLSGLQAAIANAPNGSINVDIDGEVSPAEGTNFRWSMIVSPTTPSGWDSSTLTIGTFSQPAFMNVDITRTQGRQHGYFSLVTHEGITAMTPEVTLRRIRFTVTF